MNYRNISLFGIVFILLVGVGFVQSWSVAFALVNLCLLSSVMALGVNIQWGYAGLFNVGIMGFTAIGGLAVVLVSVDPVPAAWSAGGLGALLGLALGAATILIAIAIWKRLPKGRARVLSMIATLVIGYALTRAVFAPARDAISSTNPATEGFLGGAGLPVLLAWPVGALFAGGLAWVIGKISLGLRSDYLAIATLGISEIVIAVMKFEGWLSRGVNNVAGLPRAVPRPVDLQAYPWVQSLSDSAGIDIVEMASIIEKLGYAILFSVVLVILIVLSELALKSPWGRMMRAIRDNEVAARAMGKDVKARHLMIFVLGSGVCGLAGAMMVTLDGQLTPGSYEPLRFTFLMWVMVIVGGSGNNWGSVLGGFVIWFLWVQAEPLGRGAMELLTAGMAEDNALRLHLIDQSAHTRLIMMGAALLFMLRFAPRGLIPER
ncbi:MAG: branched-chain amino acid ABC transporter permease [Rhodobacteraceae bacterium]|nr:branched-chain amino acid ABC transporter permease [Paracoccaceae bacterium]